MVPNWKRPTLREYLTKELDRPWTDEDYEMCKYDEARENLMKHLMMRDHQLTNVLKGLDYHLEECIVKRPDLKKEYGELIDLLRDLWGRVD